MVNFIKWIEESLVKALLQILFLVVLDLVFGLIIAFLIGFALTAIEVPILNTIAPILLTLLFGYLGFQVGFKKRDELLGLFHRIKRRKQGMKNLKRPIKML